MIRKTIEFLYEWRSISLFRLIQYIFMFASMPMLFYGLEPYDTSIYLTIVFTIIVFYCGMFATLIWNDINDVEIDAIAHPKRLLPSGKITPKMFFIIAILFSMLTFIFSYLVNIYCFIFVCCSALFVAIHNKYLKRRVKLPAFSEIITPLQWTIVPIFGFLAISGADRVVLVLMFLFTYFADIAHDSHLGIHDVEADRRYGIRTFSTSFNVNVASKISLFFSILSGVFGIFLFLKSILSFVFLILFLILVSYIIFQSYKFLIIDEKQKIMSGKIIGQKTYRLLWITYDLIFLDIFIQQLINVF